MPEQHEIIVIAASARALAQSAHAAGFAVHALDLFADTDTAQHCLSCTRVAGTLNGFDAEGLLAALDGVDPRARLAVVFASVIDLQPALLSRIAERRQVYGTPAAVLAHLSHPAWRRRWLRSCGVAHPDTRLRAPSDVSGWIRKRRLASGGYHIVPASCAPSAGEDLRRWYYQRYHVGMSLSVTALCSAQALRVVGFAEQTPVDVARSFRFGGACGLGDDDWPRRWRQRVEHSVARLSGNCAARGLVSFDFVVNDNDCVLLEVNARPSANFELFDEAGTLFRQHLEACRDGSRTKAAAHLQGYVPPDEKSRRLLRGYSVVYADRPVTVPPAFDWPDWVRDRAGVGTTIGEGEPLCSVHAQHYSGKELRQLLAQRVSLIGRRL